MASHSDPIIRTEESSDISFHSAMSALEESSVVSSLISPSDDSQHDESQPVIINLSEEEIQDQIDNILSQSTEDWNGTIDFP